MNTLIDKRALESLGFYNIKFTVKLSGVLATASKKVTIGKEEKELLFQFSHKRMLSRRILLNNVVQGILDQYEAFLVLSAKEKKEFVEKNEQKSA